MSEYDEVLTKQEHIEKLFLEGKIWKLDKDTYRGPEDIKNWKHAFMYGFEPTEREFIREQTIIWRADDLLFLRGSECPRYGIAGNIAHLQYLMKDDRIHRDALGIELEIWNEILELDEVIIPGETDESLESQSEESAESDGLHIDDFESTLEVSSELNTDQTDRPATPDKILEALDKIVTYLTGRYYYTHTAKGAKYGAYINDYDFNVNTMASFWDKGNAFLPDHMELMFQSGDITSWKVLIKELEYFFDCDESTESMIDIFADLTTIAMNKDLSTKMKFSQMKIKISKLLITNPEEFLTCRDSHYLTSRQTKVEEYGPMIHTLLTCMIYMASPLEKSEWRKIHDEYFRFIKKSPSYKDWHENRLDFNFFMDLKLKEGNGTDPNLNDKCNEKSIRDTRLNDVNKYSTYDNGAKNSNFEISSRCNKNQNMIGQIRANNGNFDSKLKLQIEKPRNTNSQNFNPQTQNFNPQMQNFNPQMQNDRMNVTSRWQYNKDSLNMMPKCTHCSKLSGKTVRHYGPYQGRGERCLYDTNGRKKPAICVRSEHEGELKDDFNKSEISTFDNNILQYTDTRHCMFIHSVSLEETKAVQGFGEFRERAVNESRYDKRMNKKVEKVPKTVEERKFLPHYMKLSKKEDKVSQEVKVPQCVTKGSRDNVTNMKLRKDEKRQKEVEKVPQCMTKGSRDKVNHVHKMSINRGINWRGSKNISPHRDENVRKFGNRFGNRTRDRAFKSRQDFDEGKTSEILTLNESHRDDRILEPRKRKYIDWNPYLRCEFLNPNFPGKTHYGTVKMDSGACSSFIHESLLPFCEVMKFEKFNGREVRGAGGHSIPLADYTVDIAMKIEDLGIFILRKVLVSRSPLDPFKQAGPNFLFGPSFLLGLSDMNRLKISLDFKTKRVKFGVGPNRGKWIKMKNYL